MTATRQKAALEDYDIARGDFGLDPDSVIKLAERSNSYWLKLRSPAGTVEGKLHLPELKTNKLFVFQPGFPGRGAADFEQLHLDKILASGRAAFVPRHNGSLLTGKFSDRYIFCPERQARAQAENQLAIGAEAVSPLDKWLVEPLIGMQILPPAFAETVIYGHSFGGLATMYSATKFFAENPHHNIKRLVSMAGATGRIRSEQDRIVKMWSEHIDTEWVRERVSIGSAEINLAHLQMAYRTIHEQAGNIPQDVDIVFLHPWGESQDSIDELIGINEPLELIVSLGRGTLIVDTTQKANPELEQLAHDMCDLTTAAMLQIIDTQWQPTKQILTLSKQGIS